MDADDDADGRLSMLRHIFISAQRRFRLSPWPPADYAALICQPPYHAGASAPYHDMNSHARQHPRMVVGTAHHTPRYTYVTSDDAAIITPPFTLFSRQRQFSLMPLDMMILLR